jgi:hypothetical protein
MHKILQQRYFRLDTTEKGNGNQGQLRHSAIQSGQREIAGIFENTLACAGL